MTVVMKNWEPEDRQSRGLREARIKSPTIGIFASICHAEKPLLCVLQLEVLILELIPIDGLATRPVTVRKVSALNHELLDNAMEPGAFVAEALFTCRQSSEVFCGLVVY